jgi:two-component system response regulator RegA
MTSNGEPESDGRPVLLVVDDDPTFCRVLAAALEKRGFAVYTAHTVEEGRQRAAELSPEYALVDLRLPDDSGLALVKGLAEAVEHIRIVMLTGYASIATAVEAIKLGAVHYLAKPVEVDEMVSAFDRMDGDTGAPATMRPMSVNRLEWEHLQKVLLECGGNISETARRLGMHRRTLQRKLAKRPAAE